jgi:hypothetical protein
VQENTPVHSNDAHGAGDMTDEAAPEGLLQMLLDPAARRELRMAVARAGRREAGEDDDADEDGEAQGEEPECTFA